MLIINAVKLVQFLDTISPIYLCEMTAPNYLNFSATVPKNANMLISVTDAGILIAVKLSQYLNAF